MLVQVNTLSFLDLYNSGALSDITIVLRPFRGNFHRCILSSQVPATSLLVLVLLGFLTNLTKKKTVVVVSILSAQIC